MKRKEFVKKSLIGGLGLATVAGACQRPDQEINAPNINFNKTRRWKMVTTWPPGFPVLGEAAEYFASWVEKMSAGRIKIKVFGGGELVPALEAFDTVTSGTVEMGCGASYYWAGKSPATQFFAAVPFGMNAQQMNAWLLGGGGYELWKEVYAKFNLIPLLGGNTGVQMGGWFNKEIESIDDLNGLKMRIPGLGGKVLEKAGGAEVLVAGGEIYTSLERGVIDAAEWIGPYHDYRMGFHKISKYYYYPGWHEPGAELEFFVNKVIYEDLPDDLQEIVMSASLRCQAWMLAEFDAQNAIHLDKLLNEEGVVLKRFPDEVLNTLRKYTAESIEEVVGGDDLSLRVYDSYRDYMKRSKAFLNLTEKEYYQRIL